MGCRTCFFNSVAGFVPQDCDSFSFSELLAEMIEGASSALNKQFGGVLTEMSLESLVVSNLANEPPFALTSAAMARLRFGWQVSRPRLALEPRRALTAREHTAFELMSLLHFDQGW